MKTRFSLCTQDSCGQEILISRGPKPASDVENQTLRMTVRMQGGEEEEEQDKEISGLINSDGAVVEWESKCSASTMQMFLFLASKYPLVWHV